MTERNNTAQPGTEPRLTSVGVKALTDFNTDRKLLSDYRSYVAEAKKTGDGDKYNRWLAARTIPEMHRLAALLAENAEALA